MKDFSEKNLMKNSIYVLREAEAKFDNPVQMFAGGKDSVLLLELAEMAFMKNIPYPFLFIDTGFQFEETYEFIKKIEEERDIEMIWYKNENPFEDIVGREYSDLNPYDYDVEICCGGLKSEALYNVIKEYDFDAVITGIRWTEQIHRAKEYYFSPRRNPPHTRVHPLLNWMEWEVWEMTRKLNLPVNPLYTNVVDGKRMRSIGCEPCTERMETEYGDGKISVEQIVSETRHKKLHSERKGREMDKEKIMDTLREEKGAKNWKLKRKCWEPML